MALRFRRAAVLAGLLLSVAAGGCRSEPPVLSRLPDFTLTDAGGAAFGSRQLAGKPWVANFIFTRCPTICPMFTAKMADVQARVKKDGLDVNLVSFTVDPAYDTPERLAAYAKEHGADPGRWHFLTGDPEAIRTAVVEGLKIAAQPIGPDDDLASVFHGSHFVLVDGEGRIRGYYDSADADATDRLLADLRRL